jgi:hypothetical protein
MNHDFKIVNADTDSISFCKADGGEFSAEEQTRLLNELNSLFPSQIHWEHDGIYSKFIVLKAKNYILYNGKKVKIKGSALRASTKEPALKEFIKEIIDAMLYDKNNYQEIYWKYAQEIMNVQDMKRWASRKTITTAVLGGKRTNEKKVLDALEGSEYVEGDRVFMFFKSDQSLSLIENFNGDYCKKTLLKKLFNTAQIFGNILDVKQIFPNLTLKRNGTLLNEMQQYSKVS